MIRWCHFCSVVAMNWVDLTKVTWNIHTFSYVQHLKCILSNLTVYLNQIFVLVACFPLMLSKKQISWIHKYLHTQGVLQPDLTGYTKPLGSIVPKVPLLTAHSLLHLSVIAGSLLVFPPIRLQNGWAKMLSISVSSFLDGDAGQ